MARKITKEVAKERLKKEFPNYKLLTFKSIGTYATFECNKGHKWSAVASRVINDGNGCPVCSKQHQIHHQRLVASRHFDTKLAKHFNGSIKRIGVYKNTYTKTKFQCSKSKYHVWLGDPRNVIKRGCPFCNGVKHTTKWLSNAIKHCGFQPLETAHSLTDMIKIKCPRGHVWTSNVDIILYGHEGCPVCRYLDARKPFSWLVNIAHKRHYTIVNHTDGKYARRASHVTVKCPKGHLWNTDVHTFLASDCPFCNGYHGEIDTARYLRKHGFTYLANKSSIWRHTNSFVHSYHIHFHGKMLSYDFLVNINGSVYAIEFDGVQHHHAVKLFGGIKKFKKQVQHDHLKDMWSMQNLHHSVIRINNAKDLRHKQMQKLVNKTLTATALF